MSARNAKVLAVIAAGAATALWGAGVVKAGPSPHMSSGLIGITRGDTVRFGIVNVGDVRGLVVESCRFVDSQGNALGEAEPRRQRLGLGQATYCDLDGDTFAIEGRTEVQGVVEFRGHRDDIAATVQVFGNSDAITRMGWNSNHNETLVR